MENAKEMFEKLDYIMDSEPRFGSLVSYTKYCKDGCCRLYDLIFYKNGNISFEEDCLTCQLIQAISKQIEELNLK
jgi:hypothetical protein